MLVTEYLGTVIQVLVAECEFAVERPITFLNPYCRIDALVQIPDCITSLSLLRFYW